MLEISLAHRLLRRRRAKKKDRIGNENIVGVALIHLDGIKAAARVLNISPNRLRRWYRLRTFASCPSFIVDRIEELTGIPRQKLTPFTPEFRAREKGAHRKSKS